MDMPMTRIAGGHDHFEVIDSALINEDRPGIGLAIDNTFGENETWSGDDRGDICCLRRIERIRPGLEDLNSTGNSHRLSDLNCGRGYVDIVKCDREVLKEWLVGSLAVSKRASRVR